MELTFITLVKAGMALAIGWRLGIFCCKLVNHIADAFIRKVLDMLYKEDPKNAMQLADKIGYACEKDKSIGFKY